MSETSNQAGVPVRGPACKRCPVLEAQVKRLRAEIERLAREHSFCEPAGRLLETEIERLRAEIEEHLAYIAEQDDDIATLNAETERLRKRSAQIPEPITPEDIGMVQVWVLAYEVWDIVHKQPTKQEADHYGCVGPFWRFPDE